MQVLRVLIVIALTALPLCAVADDEQVAKLIDELQHANAAQASKAAKALGELDDAAKPAVPALIKALSDHREDGSFPYGPVRSTVSFHAYSALMALGSVAVPELTAALDVGDDERRLTVIRVLGSIGQPAKPAAPRLRQIASKSASENLRFYALDVCVDVDPRGPGQLALLQRALHDKSPDMRGLAVRGLGAMGADAESMVDELTDMLSDQSLRTQGISADFSTQRPVRFDAAEALGKIGPAAKPAKARLIQMMKHDPNLDVRVSVALAVFRIDDGSDAAMQSLIKSLNEGGGEGIFGAAQNALEELGTRAAPAFDALVKSLKDESEFRRMDSIRALAAIGDRKAVPILISMLDDEDGQVRSEAAEELGRFGVDATPAVPRLIELLSDEELYCDDQDKIAATLGKIGPSAKAALPLLRKLAAPPDYCEKAIVAEAIEKISGDK